MKYKLTDALAKTLEAPPTGNRIYYDEKVGGFGVRVTAGGVRSYVVTYRHGDRQRRYTIGKLTEWTCGAAREQARRVKRGAETGDDPLSMRDREKAAPSVHDLYERYKTDHLPKKRPACQRDDMVMWEREILPRLGKYKVHDLTPSDVDRLHHEITRRGAPTRANRVIALFRKSLNLSKRWGWITVNPCEGIQLNPEQSRQRYLTPPELQALLGGIEDEGDARLGNFVKFLLLTGCRRGEAMAARWEDFDLTAGVWSKPPSSTKAGRLHRVPLSGPARALLDQMRREAKGMNSPWLFPGDKEGEHLQEPKRKWDNIRAHATLRLWREVEGVPELIDALAAAYRRAPRVKEVEAAARAANIALPPGLLDFRLHDLRHSYASFLASAGMSLPLIGQLLGHSQTQTTARYAHLLDDPLREASERVGAIVSAAGRGDDDGSDGGAEVIDFKKGRGA